MEGRRDTQRIVKESTHIESYDELLQQYHAASASSSHHDLLIYNLERERAIERERSEQAAESRRKKRNHTQRRNQQLFVKHERKRIARVFAEGILSGSLHENFTRSATCAYLVVKAPWNILATT